MTRPATISAIMIFATAALVPGAEEPARIAVAEPSPEILQATVVQVTGQAEKLLAGKSDKWESLKVGDKLDELSIIRTGLRSSATIKLADRGQIVVKSGTKVGIAEFRKKGQLVTTRLGLKYGSMSVAVDSTRGPNDAEVSTPAATLSVRGTKGEISYTGGNRVILLGEQGTWHAAADGRSRNVAAGESTDGNLTPSIELTLDGRDSFRVVTGVTPQEKNFLILHGGTGSQGGTNVPSVTSGPDMPPDRPGPL